MDDSSMRPGRGCVGSLKSKTCSYVLYSKSPLIQFLLLGPKSCQAILSKPLPTGKDCTCCLATVAYRTFNQGDCGRHVLQISCSSEVTKQANMTNVSGNKSC